MRRPAVAVLVLATVLGSPSLAGASPDPRVPDPNLARSVLTLDTAGATRDIDPAKATLDLDLSKAVLPLEEEQKEGAKVTVRISSDVLFDFDKATLTDAARRRVSRLAPRLREAGRPVQVAGHSDAQGDPGYNLRLSKQRAEAVRAELERLLRGTPVKITAVGHGEDEPVAPNEVNGKDNPEGRAKNRRVDITF
ncbi:OmpA family protein [Actinomadura hibisca]|uniref:OmpA family protein n=1 Tax=Actinomadura hibisca TaxID=68565 RepID=UPI000831A648|nr:OmpA family protein [Actinomadura hibisca]